MAAIDHVGFLQEIVFVACFVHNDVFISVPSLLQITLTIADILVLLIFKMSFFHHLGFAVGVLDYS